MKKSLLILLLLITTCAISFSQISLIKSTQSTFMTPLGYPYSHQVKYIAFCQARVITILDLSLNTVSTLPIQTDAPFVSLSLLPDLNNNGNEELLISYNSDVLGGVNYVAYICDLKTGDVIKTFTFNLPSTLSCNAFVGSNNKLYLNIIVSTIYPEPTYSGEIYDLGVTVSATDIQTDHSNIPAGYSLSQNYPNPFNPSTRIDYTIQSSGSSAIKIYNVSGQLVRIINKSNESVGTHSVEWDGLDNNGIKVSSGVYIYQLESKDFKSAKKMLLMK